MKRCGRTKFTGFLITVDNLDAIKVCHDSIIALLAKKMKVPEYAVKSYMEKSIPSIMKDCRGFTWDFIQEHIAMLNSGLITL